MDAPNYGFREIANEWIALSDGCRLAARIWLPDECHSHPVPAILEYLPYRKRGGTDLRDDITYPHFANAGYAVLQVNAHGTPGFDWSYLSGSSEDTLRLLQDDVVDAARWAIREELVNAKRICLYGKGLGGYTALMTLIANPETFSCAVSYGGVYDLAAPFDMQDFDSSLTILQCGIPTSINPSPWQR